MTKQHEPLTLSHKSLFSIYFSHLLLTLWKNTENPIKLMLYAIQAKKTHKKTIERDSLRIELACETGITQGEV